MRYFIAVFFLGLRLFSFGQINEKFTDKDFSQNPIWLGTTADFLVNSSEQLQTSNSIASSSFLTTNHLLNSLDNIEWRCWVKLGFSPSSNNFSRIYLTSNNSDLTVKPDGFFLQLGETGALDAVHLMKSIGGVESEICAGIEGQIASAFAITVKVVRSQIGNWRLYIDPSGGNYFEQPAVGFDSTQLIGTSFGLMCKYSVSNTSKFYFDNIYCGPIERDTIPPSISSINVIFNQQVDVLFSEAVESSTINMLSNYKIDGLDEVNYVQIDASNPRLVHLSLLTPLINGQTYQMSIFNVKDIEGNSETLNEEFTYRLSEIPRYGDVIITEIMADPTPSFGLPEMEYIEIYNRSSKVFNLNNWKVKDLTTTGTISDRWLLPGAYQLIGATSIADEFDFSVGCSNFPNLNNSGDHLQITYSDGTLIDEVEYKNSWILDEAKQQGGYSLERKDLDLRCFKEENWNVSIAELGGTPGIENSIQQSLYDIEQPYVSSVEIISDSTLTLYFNEEIDSVSLASAMILSDPDLNLSSSLIQNRYVKSLDLAFSIPFSPQIDYLITLENVSDCSQNSADLKVNFVFPESEEIGDVIINEILFNPPIGGSDYVELFNKSTKNIDLYGWKLANIKDGELANYVTIESHFIIQGGDYALLTADVDFVASNYANTIFSKCIELQLPTYKNDSSTVVLLNPNNRLMDRVPYQSSWHLQLIDDEKGKALERIDPDGSSLLKQNWRTAAETVSFGTPTLKNSQHLSNQELSAGFVMLSETITPNNDGTFDFLEISYQFDNAGLIGTFLILDKNGLLVKTVFSNELLPTKGTFIWDGINEEGLLAKSGIFIALIETFEENSFNKKYFKKAFVVYSN